MKPISVAMAVVAIMAISSHCNSQTQNETTTTLSQPQNETTNSTTVPSSNDTTTTTTDSSSNATTTTTTDSSSNATTTTTAGSSPNATTTTTTGSSSNISITEACGATQYKELCTEILTSSPKSSGADLFALAEVVMETAADNASTIYSTLNQLQNGSANWDDSFIDQSVTDCLESYQDAIDQFEDSITALDFKAYNDIKTWISAVMSDITTCDAGFKNNPAHPSPIAEMSAKLNQTCSIILSFNQLMSEGKNKVTS